MRICALVGLVTFGCAFEPPSVNPENPGGTPDAGPPPSADVRFVSVSSSASELAPGRYGIEVTAVLRNDLEVDIADVAVSLRFSDDTDDRADWFRWRDFDRREQVEDEMPRTLAAGAEATYRFMVEALAATAPSSPIQINGSAVFRANGQEASATPADSSATLGIATMNPPIVVDTADDDLDDNAVLSFREALIQARSQTGLDRIVFDPASFPPGQETLSILDANLGELPTLDGTGGDLVIDGSGAGVVLAADSNWTDPTGRYGLRVAAGTVVIHRIGFRDMGHNYLEEDVGSNNCGPLDTQHEGGAIRVDGGTLILDEVSFSDPNVNERNCYAATVRLHGGSGHRIIRTRFTEPSMDSLFIAAPTVEVRDSVMVGSADTDKSDECIYVDSMGGQDLWVVGNLCVDQEYSGVVARGTDRATLYVVNNTFVRNGLRSLSAVRREQGMRPVVLRNNVYVANNPSAVGVDGDGSGFNVAYEAVTGSGLCDPSCGSATVDSASIVEQGDLGLANPAGSSMADFTPEAGSPLVGSAVGWLDRNGSAPGRYNGEGSERGAIELP